MSRTLKISLCQLNPIVGAFSLNATKIRDAYHKAAQSQPDFVAFPEMFLSGYQTQDLVLRRRFLEKSAETLAALLPLTKNGPAMGVGCPIRDEGHGIYNAYVIVKDGEILTVNRKILLPNTHVFDEKRVFTPGDGAKPYHIGATQMGTPICEDAWFPDVTKALKEEGAEFLLVPNGSPYSRGKWRTRLEKMTARTRETHLPLIYLNMVGGQDDQVFDGGSFVLNSDGSKAVQLPFFEETIRQVDFEFVENAWRAKADPPSEISSDLAQDYHAIVLGLRDYVAKSGFSSVILGLSGGIDSALVAAIAVDALGAANVRCVMLPSEFTSKQSRVDAEDCANRLGVKLDRIDISEPRAALEAALAPQFVGYAEDLTEENIQSRLRGLLLMALSNKFGAMLLTTGNKSEVAVGYATIYGDMNGGFNPIKDLYKLRVFALSRWRNQTYRPWMKGAKAAVIPDNILEKAPSAELRADQKDEDSLPPYEILDPILERLVDWDWSVDDIVNDGFERALVKKIEELVFRSEYKRYQSAPGPRLTTRAFWLDRRYPIVNHWRDE